VALTQTITVQNDSYPINVSWALSPLQSNIYNVTLYISTYFDLQFRFDKVQIPQLMDWINPWDAPSPIKSVHGTDWVVASFSSSDLKDNYVGLYDDTNDIAFAFNFTDLPNWGNIGALGNRQIDAVRFEYPFSVVNVNQTVSCSYQELTLSKNSFPTLQPSALEGLLTYNPPQFTVATRDYRDYIKDNNIGFIVYDKNKLDTQMVHSKILQLIYSNDRYVIFKILK
jgi:hypothetical protein